MHQRYKKFTRLLNISRRPMRAVWLSLFAAVLAVMTACKATDEAGNSQNSNDSQAIISLTDAPGDFLSYTVDVTSLTLTKANGAVVHTLPLTTRIDFTEYTDMTEFLTAASVPSGTYVKAEMGLDYQNAEIWVEDANGDPQQVANIVDNDGNAVSQLTVAVHLEDIDRMVIVKGVPAHVTFDFNLNASNSVEFDSMTGEPTLTVDPVLLADTQLEAPKPHRVRGPLQSVDIANSSYEVILRPFRHAMSSENRFGKLTVETNADTTFEIDEVGYQGQSGLEALNAKPAFTATIAIGDLKFHPRRFVASEVYAGSSVPGGTLDVARGSVVARNGNVLTLRGATLIRAGGSVIFNDTVSVTLADTTKVRKQFSTDAYNIDAISVGQAVSVAGSITNNSIDNLQLDASNGVVRLRISKVRGHTQAMDSMPPMLVGVQSINLRPVAAYDFAGTGVDPANDADPTQYEIDPGTLDLSGIADNTPVIVGGFVTPFASAPADFVAQTVVDLTEIPAVLVTNWNPASASPFTAIASTGLTLNLSGSGRFHHVGRAGLRTDLSQANVDTQITPTNDSLGLYVIKQNGVRQLHTTFADFVADIEARLANGDVLQRTVAVGRYNDASGVFTTSRIHVVFE